MKGKREQIYQLLLEILLVCALPVMALLGYWACRYSYYGTVDYSIRNILVKDTAWKHILVFLLAVAAVWGLDRMLARTKRVQQEKICLGVLLLKESFKTSFIHLSFLHTFHYALKRRRNRTVWSSQRYTFL